MAKKTKVKIRYGAGATVSERIGSPLDLSKEKKITKEAPARETDINVLVEKYYKGDPSILTSTREAIYQDVSEIGDFFDAQERVSRANEMFAALPAKLRSLYDNDPGKFVEAASQQKEKFVQSLIDHGVIQPPPTSGPKQTRPKSAPSSGAKKEAGDDPASED